MTAVDVTLVLCFKVLLRLSVMKGAACMLCGYLGLFAVSFPIVTWSRASYWRGGDASPFQCLIFLDHLVFSGFYHSAFLALILFSFCCALSWWVGFVLFCCLLVGSGARVWCLSSNPVWWFLPIHSWLSPYLILCLFLPTSWVDCALQCSVSVCAYK